jgi:DUF1680 family protein
MESSQFTRREVIKLCAAGIAGTAVRPSSAFAAASAAHDPVTAYGVGPHAVRPVHSDALAAIDPADMKVGGEIGRRIGITITNNILRLDVDKRYLRHFGPKNCPDGSFWGLGTFMDGVVKLAYYTRDPQLMTLKDRIVSTAIEDQDADGYIGCMAPENRMWKLWDIHESHYIIYGLLSNYELFGDESSLAAARKAANYILNHWSSMPPYWEADTQVAVFIMVTGLDRTMVRLYRVTGDRRYLDFELKQRNLVNWDQRIKCGRRSPLQEHTYGYFAMCMAQLELYRVVPDKKLLVPTLAALRFLMDSNGMLITGGVGQAECWTDDQDGGRDLQETCSTCYQLRVYDNLLRLTGDSRYGDLIERTLYNTFFGAESVDGFHLRYFTPLAGERVYADDATCCPNNFRRMVPELVSVVCYRDANGAAINLYSPCQVTVKRDDGSYILIQQRTDYPTSGNVVIRIDPSAPGSFPLRLRIPLWCKSATVSVNGEPSRTVCTQGTFAVIDRSWKPGDEVQLKLPMEWRLVKGRLRQAGRAAIMRGPMVFCLDPSQSKMLVGESAANLGRIVIDKHLIDPNPVSSSTVRPDGIGCRLKGGTVPGALGDGGNITLTLTEFPDPNGRCCYFKVPNLSAEALQDELVGLWKGRAPKCCSALAT